MKADLLLPVNNVVLRAPPCHSSVPILPEAMCAVTILPEAMCDKIVEYKSMSVFTQTKSKQNQI